MSAGKLRAIRFPGRYIQGPGALGRLPAELAGMGHALVLLDPGPAPLIAPQLEALPDATVLEFGGECCLAGIARVLETARKVGAGVIVGIGGGKALDTAKAAAEDHGVAAFVLPTSASSDAPCSALSVIYHPDGSVSHDRFLRSNPALVLADTAIIARAPARLLSAGIGDGLATWYEAESCRQSGAPNCLGMGGAFLAHDIARACRDILMEHGVAALAECRAGQPGPALERVVEANILMSGIGFESGGVATAHAIHHGLMELDEVHGALHGEKVAIGILTGLLIQGRDAEFDRVRGFLKAVGLPVSLRDIGIMAPDEDKLMRVALRATRPGEIIHHEPQPVGPDQVTAALRRLQD